ncbi:MAG TPA: RNA 2',3'-cyclic phosphodiesterase [Actinotalea sp.]|nr:RNA 2',3'-cyclic phosphodiesterase [Actinotalea sp.]
MRLFVAIRPPAPVLAHLEAALVAVRGAGRGAAPPGAGPLRWVPEPDRHITLAFLGEIPDGYLDEVTDGLGRAVRRVPPFDLALRGAGLVDRRVLWVGCAGDTAALAGLMADLADAADQLVPARHADDRVRSRAHLTVARVRDRARARGTGHGTGHAAGQGTGHSAGRPRSGGPDPAEVVRALAVYHGPTWTVDRAVLVRSRLGAGPGGGPLYADLATLPSGSAGSAPGGSPGSRPGPDGTLWQDDGHGAAPRTGE